MKLIEAFNNIRKIEYLKGAPPVVVTVTDEIVKEFPKIKKAAVSKFGKAEDGILKIAVADKNVLKALQLEMKKDTYVYLQMNENGSGILLSSHTNFLYAFVRSMLEDKDAHTLDAFKNGYTINPAFKWQRLTYDYFLTQPGRIQKNLNRESYIQGVARLGFTHLEVNALAYPMGLETGPKGETYPMFYTYCAALDQFVYSKLNKGLYPFYYLSANLKNLKENAALGVKYGMTPGMLCFEPRSVPEQFFQKYPMLRGGRVDHPFRSFQPRYNMTITHPKVLDHYAEMVTKLVKAVPELGYIDIWTNDSGAGFEHTKSLYVGRNGGAYLIREWKDDEEISRLAGENALRFLRVLRDAGKKENPKFRVITRMESFYGEHDTIWNGLEEQLEVETNSLAVKGWGNIYTHPKYPDNTDVGGGTVYQQQFDNNEKSEMADLAKRGSNAHYYFAVGPQVFFDPLMGVPVPKLTLKRMKMLKENGVDFLSHHGGSFPPDLVPYNVNHEVTRMFQFHPEIDADRALTHLAMKWAGEKYYKKLLKAWDLAEEAILAFPNVIPLYSSFGFSWYRLWVRPFIPNLDAISAKDRAFYEDHICTTPHNPNNVDLSKDVLFVLTTPEKSRVNVQRIDKNLWKPLDKAIQMLSEIEKDAKTDLGPANVIHDQLIRLKALHCWFMTQRNVGQWISCVYGYMNAKNKDQKKKQKEMLTEMMQMEIENTKKLSKLLDSDVEFMSMTDQGETPLIYGTNLKSLLPRRIKLMKKHMKDEPFIDFDYIEKKAGEPVF